MDYSKLPNPDLLTNQFKFLLNYWRVRNNFIADMRKHLGGLNDIEGPVSTQYITKVLHTYILASLINEKASRYLPRPIIQCLTDDPLDDEARAKSTRAEEGINIANYEMERRGGGDVYDRAVRDALLLDMGVVRTDRGEAAYWTELVEHDRAWLKYKENPKEYPKPDKAFSEKEREEYKRERGIPLSKEYVPLELFLPYYTGKRLDFSFEIAETSKYSILENPNYRNEVGYEVLKNMTVGPDGGLDETATVLHYVDHNYHAYYLAGPGANSGNNKYPKVSPNTIRYTGTLQPLYAYEHGINRSIYTTYGGRFGGWKTDRNEIERVGKGIMELSQAADEIVSQVLTNVRAKYWPNLNFKMDPEARGFGTGNSKPEAPKVREGESIVTFVGEEISTIFKPEDDPMVFWIYDTIQTQIGRLGGSATLFGERAPGVDTGFNQAIQQTQAQSLDNKQEQHLQQGAEDEALVTSLHIKKIGEPIELVYVEDEEESGTKTGRKKVKLSKIDPDDLTPMPRFSAQVRKQGPMDMLAALRAFAMATDDRTGKGPALSDETAREEILGITAPDVEYKKILIESQKREMIANGFISDKVGEQANVKLAKIGVPEISPEILQKADPALLAALQQIQPAAEQQGGTDPKLLSGMAEAAGLPPGPIPGDPEMGNRMGEGIEGAIQTGASIV